METIKKSLKISFSTQKGGVGKSSLTLLVASVLHYRLGYQVFIMDCDYPQHSLSQMRERDKKSVMENDYHKKAAMKQFQTINKKAYPIIKCKAEDALEMAELALKESTDIPDIIFYDLPGTVNTKGVLTTLMAMDYIFSPMIADRLVVESTLGFIKAFQQLPRNPSENKGLWLFWNQVDGREKTTLYEAYEKVIEALDLPLMKNRIMDSKRFRKESDSTASYIFKSSLLPADQYLLKATKMDLFINEFLRIIQL